MVNVKKDMTGWIMSEHGVPDSRLTVIEQADDYIKPNGKHEARWLCQCSCGNKDLVKAIGYQLTRGHIKSCGCLQHEVQIQSGLKTNNLIYNTKKYNDYDLSGDYGIGYTSNGEKFYFDLEDYDKIKNYCWHINENNYVVSDNIYLHILIMETKTGEYIDHISHKKYDNRKSNLRIVTSSQNSMNRELQSNNTSGITGVSFHKGSCMWFGYIKYNKKQIRKYAKTKEIAIELRKQLEEKYFGEYSYESSINMEGKDDI